MQMDDDGHHGRITILSATSHPPPTHFKLHRNTSNSFVETCQTLHEYVDKQGRCAKMIADDIFEFIQEDLPEFSQIGPHSM